MTPEERAIAAATQLDPIPVSPLPILRAILAAVAEEREACAEIVEARRCRDSDSLPVTVKAANHALRLAAAAIRARA